SPPTPLPRGEGRPASPRRWADPAGGRGQTTDPTDTTGTPIMKTTMPTAEQIQLDWNNNPRWSGVTRNYSAADVVRLRGTVHVEHSLARNGADKLWKYLNSEPFVNALGALTGNQAMQQVKAGLKAIYLSGWQVAADANVAGEMYPDQSLYPA